MTIDESKEPYRVIRRDEMPPIKRPGAGRGPRFPVSENHPGRSRSSRPPQKVIDAVMALLLEGGRWPQRKLAERVAADPRFRRLSPQTPRVYVSKALLVLREEGNARCVDQDAGGRNQVWEAVGV